MGVVRAVEYSTLLGTTPCIRKNEPETRGHLFFKKGETILKLKNIFAAVACLSIAVGGCNELVNNPDVDSGVYRQRGKSSDSFLEDTPVAQSPMGVGSRPFLLEGRRFFPIGAAGAPLDLIDDSPGKNGKFDRMFAELAQSGMNVYMPIFQTSEERKTSSEDVLEFYPETCESRRSDPKGGIATLKRHKLAVLLPAFIIETEADLLGQKELDEEQARRKLKMLQDCYAGVPIFAYDSYDDAVMYEGKGIPIKKVRQLKRLLDNLRRTDTPYVIMVHPAEESMSHLAQMDLQKTLRRTIRENMPHYSAPDVADSIGTYIYPVPFSPLASVGAAVDQVRALQPAQLRPLIVLQGLGLRDAQQNPDARRPTEQETRFMAFHAIVHGAGGVMWWGANFIPSNSNLWKAIKQTAQDLDTIKDWLVEADSPFPVQAAGLEVLLKQPSPDGEKYLLIAVNPQSKEQNAELSLASPKVVRSVRDMLKKQPVPVSEGRFTESFEAYGVRLYEVTIADR
jgi:hypothetical protein